MKQAVAKVFAFTSLVALPILASAQLSGNVALTTNYKFRGQDQDVLGSNGNFKASAAKPAIQGGFDYAHESGFYIGNWNSSVNWLVGNSVEMNVYGGYKFKGGGIDWDVGALGYIYPGATAGNTWEIYGAGTYASDALGAFTVKYSHTVSDDYFNYAGHKAGSGLKGSSFEVTGADGKTLNPNKARFIVALTKTL